MVALYPKCVSKANQSSSMTMAPLCGSSAMVIKSFPLTLAFFRVEPSSSRASAAVRFLPDVAKSIASTLWPLMPLVPFVPLVVASVWPLT